MYFRSQQVVLTSAVSSIIMTIDRPRGAIMELYRQAQSRLPETLSLPLQLPTMYEDFVTRNASSVSQIESALRSLTYIIPGVSL